MFRAGERIPRRSTRVARLYGSLIPDFREQPHSGLNRVLLWLRVLGSPTLMEQHLFRYRYGQILGQINTHLWAISLPDQVFRDGNLRKKLLALEISWGFFSSIRFHRMLFM